MRGGAPCPELATRTSSASFWASSADASEPSASTQRAFPRSARHLFGLRIADCGLRIGADFCMVGCCPGVRVGIGGCGCAGRVPGALGCVGGISVADAAGAALRGAIGRPACIDAVVLAGAVGCVEGGGDVGGLRGTGFDGCLSPTIRPGFPTTGRSSCIGGLVVC